MIIYTKNSHSLYIIIRNPLHFIPFKSLLERYCDKKTSQNSGDNKRKCFKCENGRLKS